MEMQYSLLVTVDYLTGRVKATGNYLEVISHDMKLLEIYKRTQGKSIKRKRTFDLVSRSPTFREQ